MSRLLRNYILLADEVVYDQDANTLSARQRHAEEPNGLITRGAHHADG